MRGLLLFLLSYHFVYTAFAQGECASYTYNQRAMVSDAGFLKRMKEIESFLTNRLFNSEPVMSPAGSGGSTISVIKIPVIVHVLYNQDEQRITEEQVRSQIEVLNRAFRKQNSSDNIPDYFKPLASDCFIEFALAILDPHGKATRGIIWKKTSVASFGSDDKIKYSRYGGDDAWDAGKYLNIWVAKLSSGIVGYSSAPGCTKEKDGIVLRYTSVGTTGAVTPPYHLGRTAVHEIGHWLGLKHIWGDRFCGDDGISDTPPQKGPTQGCPTGPVVACDNSISGSMYMNYMDLTHDACLNMFTPGQRDRMRALFAYGGPRHSLLSSQTSSTPLPAQPAVLSVDTSEVKAFSIFPNPASTILSIYTGNTESFAGAGITIYNHLGQTILQGVTTSTTTVLDVSRLKKGLYFVRVGNGSKAYKMIKR